HEDAPYVHARYREARLLCFTIWETAKTERVAETVALHQLRIDIDFGARPWTHADEGSRARRVLVLAAAEKTVVAEVRRMELPVARRNERDLPVGIPVARCEQR